ncbi:MAG TPA: hypothetical protein VGP93_21145, partial [Polyangiaceae bacterium]|nr:hypothetical protein [Polyangiaceae bacterium]
MKTCKRSFARAAILPVLLAGVASSCISTESPLITQSAEGCDEINSSTSIQSVEVDANVRRLMLAASDFSAAVD